MRITAKFFALLIIAGAASPFLSGNAIAAPATPCIVRECSQWVGYNVPGQPPVNECLQWKTTTRGDCAVHVNPNLLPPDLLRPNQWPAGGPRHTR